MPPHDNYLGLRADRVFDGERVLPGRPVIVLRAGRIEGIHGGPIAAEIPVTDYGAATLLPGLVDAHAHLVGSGLWAALGGR